MEQNSENWHGWRQKGLGSSDAPVIMGVSPYKTPFQLWEEKTMPVGYKKEKGNDFIQKKGHRLEILARADFELISGMTFAATTAEHREMPFLRASLDGWNANVKEAIEIKFIGKDYYNKTNKKLDIKPEHLWQLMHQFLVTGCEIIHYIMFNDEINKTKVIRCSPDKSMCVQLLKAEIEFWDLVTKKKAPEFTDKDFKKIPKKDPLTHLLNLYQQHKERKEDEERFEKHFLKEIKKLIKHPRLRNKDFEILQYNVSGRISYMKVPVVKSTIDKLPADLLEKYRGKGSTTTKIKFLAKDLEIQPNT